MQYKLILVFLIFCLPIGLKAQKSKPFPYIISQADVPAGFFPAGPFTKEEKATSLSANQGLVTDKKLISTIYDHANIAAIQKIYAAVFVPKVHAEDALECYVIEYKSQAILNQEQAKQTRQSGSRFLKKDRYLFIVWSDGYYAAVNTTAQNLIKKWALTDISK
ncbi:hypothetical protein ACFS5N_10695 [Mucilaginibacter ximonensis]|uniref:DUF4358 domain-containing protein n=1 Tax=Mucilaginibacter ximonensis TaxID=538021 RepID=A0ABW5YC48_9SPHI